MWATKLHRGSRQARALVTAASCPLARWLRQHRRAARALRGRLRCRRRRPAAASPPCRGGRSPGRRQSPGGQSRGSPRGRAGCSGWGRGTAGRSGQQEVMRNSGSLAARICASCLAAPYTDRSPGELALRAHNTAKGGRCWQHGELCCQKPGGSPQPSAPSPKATRAPCPSPAAPAAASSSRPWQRAAQSAGCCR
jgi:hypothetical protein